MTDNTLTKGSPLLWLRKVCHNKRGNVFTIHGLSDKPPSVNHDLYQAELQRRNVTLLKSLVWFGLLTSGAGVIARIVFDQWAFFPSFAIIFLSFAALIPLRDGLVRLLKGNATLAIYITQAPAWVMGILLGSVLDPHNQAVTFYLFVMALPLFVLDQPRRVVGVTVFWMFIYVVTALAVKPMDVFMQDMSYLAMFGMGSLATTILLLLERLDAVHECVMSEKRARTDDSTGLKNRYALDRDCRGYVGRQVMIGLACIDDLSFFVDTFGHELGEDIMRTWTGTLLDQFGQARIYRYTAQELLIVMHGIRTNEFEAACIACEKEFGKLVNAKHRMRPQVSFGYVHGTPKSIEDFTLMLSQADVRLHEASRAGMSQVRGGAFNQDQPTSDKLAAHLGGNLRSNALDALTGLPNMQAFNVRARSLIEALVPDKDNIALIYFDLENFKSFNEDHGFQKGDDLLRDVANILMESFPERLISRFSDDHFVVMCYQDEYEEGLAQALNATFDLHGRTGMPLRAGVYLLDDHDENIGIACDRARSACQSVKGRYDMFWRLYDEELRLADERRGHIISHIDDALAKGWLRVYYQPIVEARTRQVVECEALVRWIDPQFGFMPPDAFIGELERAHLIHKVDMWVAERVCADYHERVTSGKPPLPVSINLSRLDFMLCNVEEELLGFIARYEVPVSHLHVEVTESAIAEDFTQLVGITNRLRAKGFEIWLDDFGSDYSSLTTLKDFPCDVVKLDLMFLRSFDKNDNSRVIIQQVAELVGRLGARSLVEGVETEEHLAFLAQIGCDLAQGYLISKPQPLDALIQDGIIE